jgi:hypothetical protein
MENPSTINKIVINKKKRGKKKSPHTSSYGKFLKGKLPKPQMVLKTNDANKIVVVKKKPKVVEPKPKIVEQKPKVVEPKPKIVEQKPKVVEPKPKIVEQKPKVRRKSMKRSTKRPAKRLSKRVIGKSRKLDRKHLKNRRVSFRCYSKNKKKVEDVMRSTKTMDQTTLKQKLKEKGIDIKSDQTSLIRDMYIFSELGGIHIKKE